MQLQLLKYKILFLLLTIHLVVIGQSPHFKNYNIFKGKKGYTINVIFQDSKGLLWYGTSEGLVLNNGVSIKNFTTDDSLSLNFVTTITEDQNHNLWIGHKNGKISIVNSEQKISKFNTVDSLLDEPISKIKFIGKNHVLIATLGNGLVEIKDKQIRTYNSDNETADDYIYDIEQSADGKLWFGSDVGILIYDRNNNSWNKISMQDGLPDNIVKDLEFDESGMLWIGMEEEGLAVYNIDNQKITHVPMWKFGTLNHFLIRKKGEIWISTRYNGIVKLNFNDYTRFWYKNYLKTDGIINNKTENIFKDREGNIWISSKEGVSQFTGNLFEFLNTNGGLPSNQVFSFFIDSENRYWIAGANGLFVMTKSITGEFSSEHLLNNKKYKSHTFTSVFQDKHNDIWVSTYGFGVYKFDVKTLDFVNYSTKDGLSDDNVISITGNNDKIWFATSGGGVNSLDITTEKPHFKIFTKDDGLGSDYIYSSFKDSKNRVWFAKDGGGIAMMENETIQSFEDFDTLSNVTYGIVEDRSKNIWFTTANKGLIKFDGTKFYKYTVKNELVTNSFNSIIVDNYGNCVLSSNEGVTVYDVQNNQFINYGEDEGVAFMEPNLNAIHKDKSGDIWISTNNGIIKYNPDVKHEKEADIKIYITKKQAFYKDISDSTHTLSYDQNHLIFNYIGLWYKAPEKLLYRYKIKGHDLDWNYVQKSLTATYSGLPPGKYTFMVQVTNTPSEWDKNQTATFYFVIEPPFWQKWWFIGGSIIIIVLGIYLFFRLRLSNLRKAKEKLELQVEKRTAEISMQKNEIEQQKNVIEHKNKNITDSILYASRIQNAVLPPDEYIAETLPEHFILFKPRDIVSGDYYWMTKKGNETVIAVADCTGHGVPGAFMSMLGVAFLNEIVNTSNKLVASEILNDLRDHVKRSLRQTGKKAENKDGMDIALCILNQEKKSVQYAGAYNPLFLLRNGELTQIKADRMPIGIYLKEKESFTNHVLELENTDVLYMFSDGYIDQFGGNNGKKFLAKHFKELLIKIHTKPMQEQKEILNQTLETWRGELEQVDDILVMGFKLS